MPIIHATDIPIALRKPHLVEYRKQLKSYLRSPLLSSEQREQFVAKLQKIEEALKEC